MIGPFGYGADVSRTFHCKPGTPSAEQRRRYRTAVENLSFNIELLRAQLRSTFPSVEDLLVSSARC
jgi:Xaa-Pro aminopeptidase